jgi:hypothetical protein
MVSMAIEPLFSLRLLSSRARNAPFLVLARDFGPLFHTRQPRRPATGEKEAAGDGSGQLNKCPKEESGQN